MTYNLCRRFEGKRRLSLCVSGLSIVLFVHLSSFKGDNRGNKKPNRFPSQADSRFEIREIFVYVHVQTQAKTGVNNVRNSRNNDHIISSTMTHRINEIFRRD